MVSRVSGIVDPRLLVTDAMEILLKKEKTDEIPSMVNTLGLWLRHCVSDVARYRFVSFSFLSFGTFVTR